MRIQTVRGLIEPQDLGVTLMHEHTFLDAYPWRHNSHAISVPWGLRVDGVVDDEELLIEELNYYREAGGNSLVDVTNIGLGRNPEGLLRLSEATGLHIIMGAGWYREAVYPSYVYEWSTNKLADFLVREIYEGIDGTGIKPGILGEIGTERRFISPAQERVIRAVARAAKETGITVTTHTTRLGELAFEQIKLLREEGVPPKRIVIGHMGSRRRDTQDLVEVASSGCFVEIDHVGSPSSLGVQPDHQKAKNVVSLARSGYLDQILISMDHDANSQLHWFGGYGYDYLLTNFVPMLRKEGLTESEVRRILVDNPKRALAF